ncbi:UNVERIFIED_CONTAM: hypothetical protein PYX00_007969 [Menopon gallinae]|uniref:Uncharacterized protein n=1 Tax=Menopon gallinae TaxID=328185 RepID=A0AAW2HLS9_9NEOP
MSPAISPPNPTIPNDDIWKKFGILDPVYNFDLDDELSDVFEDLASVTWTSPMYAQSVTNDAREIRNHDCMWAGHCISEKHDRNSQKNKCVNLLPIKKPQKSEEVEVVAVTTSDGTVTADGNRICGRKSAVVAPTHARSILLPTRVVTAPATPVSVPKKPVSPRGNATVRLNRSRTLDSGGESPRPETPQSLSDNEDLNLDLPDMKTVEDFAVDTFGYNFVNDIVQNVGSEDSNTDESGDDFSMYLFDREQQGDTSNTSGAASPSKGSNKVKRTVVKQEVPISRHYTTNSFFSDHCYHLNKNARMDNLGVQTPSDSGEFLIDNFFSFSECVFFFLSLSPSTFTFALEIRSGRPTAIVHAIKSQVHYREVVSCSRVCK